MNPTGIYALSLIPIYTLSVILFLLVAIRSLQRNLARSRSDNDVAKALIESRNIQVIALQADLNRAKLMHDTLVRTNLRSLADRDTKIEALQRELKHKHRKYIVW